MPCPRKKKKDLPCGLKRKKEKKLALGLTGEERGVDPSDEDQGKEEKEQVLRGKKAGNPLFFQKKVRS